MLTVIGAVKTLELSKKLNFRVNFTARGYYEMMLMVMQVGPHPKVNEASDEETPFVVMLRISWLSMAQCGRSRVRVGTMYVTGVANLA